MRKFLVLAVALVLVACSGTERPKPAALAPNLPLLAVRSVWSSAIGAVDFPLEVRVVDGHALVA